MLKLRQWSPMNGFRAYNVGDRAYCLFIEGRFAARGRSIRPGLFRARWRGAGAYRAGGGEEQPPHWERHLVANVEIEGRMRWEHGGESIYFAIPDAHLLELVTPGIWANY
ncbi:glyoxalase [Serratia ureilytica]